MVRKTLSKKLYYEDGIKLRWKRYLQEKLANRVVSLHTVIISFKVTETKIEFVEN